MPEAVEAMFHADLGVFRGGPGEYIEIEEPTEGARYSTGADWAKEQDWTVIVTIRTDGAPARVVAYERIARLPWPTMVELTRLALSPAWGLNSSEAPSARQWSDSAMSVAKGWPSKKAQSPTTSELLTAAVSASLSWLPALLWARPVPMA